MSSAPTRHLDAEQLSSYLDDQLAAAERAQVETHLRGCAECERRLAGLRGAIASLQGLGRVEPPADLLGEVRRRAAAPPERDSGWGWRRWPALHPVWASAAAAGTVAVVTLAYLGLTTPVGPPGPAFSQRPAEQVAVVPPPAPKAESAAPRAGVGRAAADEVRGGIEGGVPGGVAGGIAGGVAGGVVGGVAAGPTSPLPAPPAAAGQSAQATAPVPPAPGAAPAQAVEVPEPATALEARRDEPSLQSGDVRRDRPALSKAAPTARATADELTAGGRRFVRDALGWREVGIPEAAVAWRSLPMDSATGRAYLVRLGDLRRRLGPGDRLLLREGGRVVELRGPAAPPPR